MTSSIEVFSENDEEDNDVVIRDDVTPTTAKTVKPIIKTFCSKPCQTRNVRFDKRRPQTLEIRRTDYYSSYNGSSSYHFNSSEQEDSTDHDEDNNQTSFL